MKVRISTTGDTIVMKFLRPNTDTRLEGYILGYGGSMFSKQFIQLPEDGKPYETEFDAEPKYLIAVQPIPANEVKKQCTGKVELQKPLHLVIGSVTPTSVLLSWGTLQITTSLCSSDDVRYREKNRKWNYQTCPTSDTVIDKLKPNTVYEFGVQPNSKDGTGVWSRPVVHNISMPGVEGKFDFFVPLTPKLHPLLHITTTMAPVPVVQANVENHGGHVQPQPNLKLQQQYSGLPKPKPQQPQMKPRVNAQRLPKPTDQTVTQPHPTPQIKVQTTSKLHITPQSIIQIQPLPHTTPQLKVQTKLQPHTTPQSKIQMKPQPHTTLQQKVPIQLQPHTTARTKLHAQPKPLSTAQPIFQTKPQLQIQTTFQPKLHTQPQQHLAVSQPTEHTHPLSLPQTKPKPQSHLQTTPHLESEPQPQPTPYTKRQAQPLAQEVHKTQTQPQRQDQLSSQTTPVPSIQSTYPIPQHIPYTKKRPLKTQTQPQPHPQNKSPNPPHKPKTPQQQPGVSTRRKSGIQPASKPSIISSHSKPSTQPEPKNQTKPQPLSQPKRQPKLHPSTQLPKSHSKPIIRDKQNSPPKILPQLKSQPPKNTQDHSEVDSMGNPRFIAPHVIYKTDKPPEEPCSITSSLAYFPDEEGSDQNVTGPPRLPPSNVTVVTVEGCPSFVILDWQKTDNETRGMQRKADPRVSEYVSGKDAIWTQFPFKADAHSECNGKQFVKRTWYRKFVGIQLCNSLRYKIYLSETLNGKFYNIGDQTGYGEDHCQFVDSFLDGKTGSHFLADQLPSRQGFYRALRQEPVSFGEIGGKSHSTYVGWYECGTPIPGKW
uniref:ABI family, member 3 (NESH) binding protein a n=1 Tax=Maylandia zebra TaxID=106582 RepID=A0A3P9D519_9CICH